MQFVYPQVLFALFAVAIPVIIHLFNFRRYRRVFFTNVAFLKELKSESKKQSRLRNILVLIMRILAIVAIVLAFAKPFIPGNIDQKKRKGERVAVVYLDNSFSMQAVNENGILFDLARKKAVEIASFYSESTTFYLITNEYLPAHQRLMSKADFIEAVNNSVISPEIRSVSDIQIRVKSMMDEYPRKTADVYFLSDFQKKTLQPENFEPDTSLLYFAVPLDAIDPNNIWPDSIWLESPVIRPGQLLNFGARIVNGGDNALENTSVSLQMNGNQVAVANCDIAENSSSIVNLNFRIDTPGVYHLNLIVDDDPVIYDDQLFLSFKAERAAKIATLFDQNENTFLNRIFSNDSLIDYQSVNIKQIDYSELKTYDLIFLDGASNIADALSDELVAAVDAGASICLIPAHSDENDGYKKLQRELSAIEMGSIDTADIKFTKPDFSHFLFQDVYDLIPENISLPVVFEHYNLRTSNQAGENIVFSLQNGDPYLISSKYGKGKAYTFASSINPEFTDFSAIADLFVPVFYNMALFSKKIPDLYYDLGSENIINIPPLDPGNEGVFKIRNNDGFEFIPPHKVSSFNTRLFVNEDLNSAGNYVITQSEKVVDAIAFNYKRDESHLEQYSSSEIEDLISEKNWQNMQVIKASGKAIDQELEETFAGVQLWKIFIILALVFLAIEILLLRTYLLKDRTTKV